MRRRSGSRCMDWRAKWVALAAPLPIDAAVAGCVGSRVGSVTFFERFRARALPAQLVLGEGSLAGEKPAKRRKGDDVPLRVNARRATRGSGEAEEDERMEKERGRRPLFELDETPQAAKIKVIGLGGGGSNAITRMMASEFSGVDFVVANTDNQALRSSPAPIKLQLGAKLTAGLGAGSNPEIGRNAALEDAEAITRLLEGADMIFVTAGLGGGTGTGSAPVVASLAKDLGILTV